MVTPEVGTRLFEVLGHANDYVKLGDDPAVSTEERLTQVDGWWEPFMAASARLVFEFQQMLGKDALAAHPPFGWNPPASKYYRPPDEPGEVPADPDRE